jgi:hypothetical protein
VCKGSYIISKLVSKTNIETNIAHIQHNIDGIQRSFHFLQLTSSHWRKKLVLQIICQIYTIKTMKEGALEASQFHKIILKIMQANYKKILAIFKGL